MNSNIKLFIYSSPEEYRKQILDILMNDKEIQDMYNKYIVANNQNKEENIQNGDTATQPENEHPYYVDIKIDIELPENKKQRNLFLNDHLEKIQCVFDMFYKYSKKYSIKKEKPIIVKHLSHIREKPVDQKMDGTIIRIITETNNQCKTLQYWAACEGREIIKNIRDIKLANIEDKRSYNKLQRQLYLEKFMKNKKFNNVFIQKQNYIVPNYDQVGIQMALTAYMNQTYNIKSLYVISVCLVSDKI